MGRGPGAAQGAGRGDKDPGKPGGQARAGQRAVPERRRAGPRRPADRRAPREPGSGENPAARPKQAGGPGKSLGAKPARNSVSSCGGKFPCNKPVSSPSKWENRLKQGGFQRPKGFFCRVTKVMFQQIVNCRRSVSAGPPPRRGGGVPRTGPGKAGPAPKSSEKNPASSYAKERKNKAPPTRAPGHRGGDAA